MTNLQVTKFVVYFCGRVFIMQEVCGLNQLIHEKCFFFIWFRRTRSYLVFHHLEPMNYIVVLPEVHVIVQQCLTLKH